MLVLTWLHDKRCCFGHGFTRTLPFVPWVIRRIVLLTWLHNNGGVSDVADEKGDGSDVASPER